MINKCPGQDSRNLKAELITCQGCGRAIEIFSDESKLHCPGCRALVFRQGSASCLQWCRAARECVGEERWRELRGIRIGPTAPAFISLR